MTRAELKRQRADLTERIAANEAELADTLADLEEAEGARERVQAREPSSAERRAELRERAADLTNRIRSDRQRARDLRARHTKLAAALKRTGRRLRNLARPKIVDLDLDFAAMTPQGQIVGSVGHYTAGPVDDDDEHAFALWRSYHAAHRAKGWAGIGYQLGLTRDGTLVRLRPLSYVGAHTLGYNTGRAGLSVHGTTGDTWTKPQLRALRFALKKFDLAALPLIGHHQAPGQATACPGAFLNGYVSKGVKP